MTLRMRSMGEWLRLACALLLLSLGFAHKPIGTDFGTIRAAASAVASGDFAGQICIGDADQKQPVLPGWHGCEACLIASGAILPTPPVEHSKAKLLYSAIDFPDVARNEPHRVLRPGSPVRGPPARFA